MKKKWFEDILRYLFRMARVVTNYRTTHMTPKGNINIKGRRKITKLMQIKYSSDDFKISNVSQVLAFVTRKQDRSQFQESPRGIYDRAMLAAEEEGFLSAEEFAQRMTN